MGATPRRMDMIQVFLVFGILTAFNIGFGYAVSEADHDKNGAVDVEMIVED